MDARHPLEVDGESLDQVVVRAGAGVRSRARHEWSGEQNQGRSRDQQAGPGRPTGRRWGVVGTGRQVDQDDRGPHQRHRQQEVDGDERVPEPRQHDQTADDDLGDDTHDQAERPAGQVGTARHPSQRAGDGKDHEHRHQPGDVAVHRLDERVGVGLGDDRPVLARGPVAAPQPGIGQPHARAGDDARAQRPHGRQAEPAVGVRGDPHGSTLPTSATRRPAAGIHSSLGASGAADLP